MFTAWAQRAPDRAIEARPQRRIIVATKAGRRLSPHTADGYNERNLAGFIEDSLRNLATDCLDLCSYTAADGGLLPAGAIRPMDRLVEAGKLRYYG